MRATDTLAQESSIEAKRDLAEQTFDLLDTHGTGELRQPEIERLLMYSGAYNHAEVATSAEALLTSLSSNQDRNGHLVTRAEFIDATISGVFLRPCACAASIINCNKKQKKKKKLLICALLRHVSRHLTFLFVHWRYT
jgi:hypothetical protein